MCQIQFDRGLREVGNFLLFLGPKYIRGGEVYVGFIRSLE